MYKTKLYKSLLILISLFVFSLDMSANIKNPTNPNPCTPPCCEKRKEGNQVHLIYHCKNGCVKFRQECEARCHIYGDDYDRIIPCTILESPWIPCCVYKQWHISETYECDNLYCNENLDFPDCEFICYPLLHNMPGCIWSYSTWRYPVAGFQN